MARMSHKEAEDKAIKRNALGKYESITIAILYITENVHLWIVEGKITVLKKR